MYIFEWYCYAHAMLLPEFVISGFLISTREVKYHGTVFSPRISHDAKTFHDFTFLRPLDFRLAYRLAFVSEFPEP